jgi:CubicO group peptidase (beta-lactamase class C family)
MVRPFLRILLPGILVCLAYTSTSQAQSFERTDLADAGFSAERIGRLSTMLQEYAASERIAGAVALVLRDGKIVFEASVGFRDIGQGDRMESTDMFRIASQTKAITSVGIMILQEQGRLLLSDPVSTFLPEFASTKVAVASTNGTYEIVDASRQITIRDLLTHTSGISYGYGPAAEVWNEAGIQGWYFANRDEPIREVVRRMAALPMDAQPGEKFVYGYSTDILGVIIEEITGQKLGAFLHEQVFLPLGMTDTHFFVPQDKWNRVATVYSATPNGKVAKADDPGMHIGQGHYLSGPQIAESAGAGLVSTATDYARFLQMLLNGGELDGIRILSPKTVELMTVNHLHDIEFRPGQGISLAFDVLQDVGIRGTPGSIGDYGWGGAYHSTYWVSPKDRLVVVFMTQLIPATGSDIHAKFRTLLYQAMLK